MHSGAEYSYHIGMVYRVNTYKVAIVLLTVSLVILASKIMGPTGLGRINSLEDQIAKQNIVADTLLQRNQLIAEDLERIKTDERQMEALARYHLGMIKPGEVFVQTRQ